MDFSQIVTWDKELLLALNGSDSAVWDQFMFVATKTVVWIPLFLSLLYMVMKSNSARQAMLLLACVAGLFLVSEGISSGICKPLVGRLRPTHDPEIMGMVQTVNGLRGGMYSFFSSHAANTFSLFMFLSLVVRSWSFTLTMLSWAMVHTYTRIYLGLHFPGDVFVGFCFGLIWGTIMYLIYSYLRKKWFDQHDYVSEQCTPSGYFYASANLVTLTFVLSVMVVLIYSFFNY